MGTMVALACLFAGFVAQLAPTTQLPGKKAQRSDLALSRRSPQLNHAGLLAGQLGATYFIPTVIVPLLLITHGLAFRILLQHQPEPAMQESRHPA
jgi:hypothetical protein